MAQNTDFILELLQENGMVTEEQVSEGWKKVAEQDGQINIIDALKQLKYVDEFEMISMLGPGPFHLPDSSGSDRNCPP